MPLLLVDAAGDAVDNSGAYSSSPVSGDVSSGRDAVVAAGGRGTPSGSDPSPMLTGDTSRLPSVARKLHVQYSHASIDSICSLLRTQGVRDSAVMAEVRQVAA